MFDFTPPPLAEPLVPRVWRAATRGRWFMFDFLREPATTAETTAEPEIVTDLRAARALIARGHATLAFARDRANNWVDPRSPSATSWCLWGAAMAASGESIAPRDWFWMAPASGRGRRVIDALEAANGFRDACSFNNKNTQATILAAFDKAIAAELARA